MNFNSIKSSIGCAKSYFTINNLQKVRSSTVEKVKAISQDIFSKINSNFPKFSFCFSVVLGSVTSVPSIIWSWLKHDKVLDYALNGNLEKLKEAFGKKNDQEKKNFIKAVLVDVVEKGHSEIVQFLLSCFDNDSNLDCQILESLKIAIKNNKKELSTSLLSKVDQIDGIFGLFVSYTLTNDNLEMLKELSGKGSLTIQQKEKIKKSIELKTNKDEWLQVFNLIKVEN